MPIPDVTVGGGGITVTAVPMASVAAMPSPVLSANVTINAPQRNFILYSENLENANWDDFFDSTNVTQDATTSPPGDQTADKLYETTSNGFHVVFESIVLTDGVVYTVSTYAKSAERTRCCLSLDFYNGTAGLPAVFDLNAGTVTSTPAGGSASITDAGNGWWRVSLTQTAGAGYSPSIGLIKDSGQTNFQSWAGDGSSGIYVWGFQLELGALTTYQPTIPPAVDYGVQPSKAVAAMRVPTVGYGVTVTAVPMAATAALVAPAVNYGATITAVPATATAALQVPVVGYGATITAVPATATAAMPAPAVNFGVTVTAVPAEAAATLQIPSVQIFSGVVVDAVPMAATAAMPAPTFGYGTTITAIPAQAIAALLATTQLVGPIELPLGVAFVGHTTDGSFDAQAGEASLVQQPTASGVIRPQDIEASFISPRHYGVFK
jgi:hypothetical protein